MKLICLNIWGGQVYEPLIKFIREQAESTDIFCFQEVFRSPRKDIDISRGTRIHILDELAVALPDFNYVFHPVINGMDNSGPVDLDIEMGQAEFIKKSISVISSGDVSISPATKGNFQRKQEFSPSNFGYFRIHSENRITTFINVHGLTYNPDDKFDTPERLEQSRLIKEFAVGEKSDVIICGDFNIMPKTKGITIFEDSFVELVKKYNISTTRSKISPWYGTPNELKFSYYAFVSPSLKVSDFQVPDVEISDHLPLVIEF